MGQRVEAILRKAVELAQRAGPIQPPPAEHPDDRQAQLEEAARRQSTTGR